MNLIISYKYLFMVLIKRPVVYSVEFHEDLFKNFKLNGYLLAELLFVVIFTRIGK